MRTKRPIILAISVLELLMILFLWIGIPRNYLEAGENKTPTLILKRQMSGEVLGRYLNLLSDRSHTFEFEDILHASQNSKFERSKQDVPNFGLDSSIHWFHISIHNPFPTEQSILLENKFSFVDQFEVFFRNKSGDWERKSAGDQIDFRSRDIATRQVVFRLSIPPGTHELYGRTYSEGAQQLPLYVWSEDAFDKHNSSEYIWIGILLGFHLVVCFYNLFLFLSLRDRTYFIYITYVLSNLLYQAVSLGILQQYLSYLNLHHYSFNRLMIVLVDACGITGLLFGKHFLNLRRRLPKLNIYLNISLAVSGFNVFNTLFLSLQLGTAVCLLTAANAATITMVSSFLVMRQGYSPARYFLAAFSAYILGVSFTLLNLIELFPSSELSRWGQFTGGAIELTILSLALGARINEKRRQQVVKINDLNQNLEEKVEQRTAEIKSLLEHIPQGILSIGEGGLIEANYSKQLEAILNDKVIAQQSFNDKILCRSNLSQDRQDQVWQSILTSLGEDEITFLANEDKLPQQIRYTYRDWDRIFRVTWNFQLDRNNTVRRILVTLLDATSEVAAQEALKKRNDEIAALRQLVVVDDKSSIQFFNSSKALLEENERLLSADTIGLEDIKILFVNAHTLKGAARTLHLDELSEAFHTVESSYADLLHKPNPVISTTLLRHEFISAKRIFDGYLYLHEHVLHRNLGSRIALEKNVLHRGLNMLQSLRNHSGIDQWLKEEIEESVRVLESHLYISIKQVLSELSIQAEKVANDLSKAKPYISIKGDSLNITHKEEDILRNCLIHIIRNSLDHGIESPENRIAKNKNPHGHIQFCVTTQEDYWSIFVEDDGAGIDISKIREKAKLKGVGDSIQTPEALASLIFESGFSTANSISMISGRGVGMSAIKRYMEQIGGHAGIDIIGPADPSGQRYTFRLVLKFPVKRKSELGLTSKTNIAS